MKFAHITVIEADTLLEALHKFHCRDHDYYHPLHERLIPVDKLHYLEDEVYYEPFVSTPEEDLQVMMFYSCGFGNGVY